MMGNFKCSLEKRLHVSVCVSLSLCLYVVVGGFRDGAKLKIHKALSGDEVKCCQSI